MQIAAARAVHFSIPDGWRHNVPLYEFATHSVNDHDGTPLKLATVVYLQ